MYSNFIENRKMLGYKTISDNNYGIKLALITDSIVLVVQNFSYDPTSRNKKKLFHYIIGCTLLFSNIEPTEAVCLPVPIV